MGFIGGEGGGIYLLDRGGNMFGWVGLGGVWEDCCGEWGELVLFAEGRDCGNSGGCV